MSQKVFCPNGRERGRTGKPTWTCSYLCTKLHETGRKDPVGQDPEPWESGRAGGVGVAPLFAGTPLPDAAHPSPAFGRGKGEEIWPTTNGQGWWQAGELRLKQPKSAPVPRLFPGNRQDEDARTQPSPWCHSRTAKQREATTKKKPSEPPRFAPGGCLPL